MKWLSLCLLLLVVAAGCHSRKEAPVAADPAACGSATAAVCGPPPTASASPIDTAQSEVCKHTCASKEAFSDRDVVPAAQAKVGDLTRCPVSGVVFRVSTQSPQVEYGGHSLRVCCEGCAEKFREQPSRFSGS
jgi:hypothetical protein